MAKSKGKRFTPEQIKQFRFRSFIQRNEDLLMKLMDISEKKTEGIKHGEKARIEPVG